MTAFLLSLDHDLAGHLAVAIRRHRSSITKNGLAEPEGLAQIEAMLIESVSRNQHASPSVTVTAPAEDDSHARTYLTRRDVRQLTGASLSTIDRWISTGRLHSTRTGRTRRVARTDLDAFLRAAA